MIYRFGPGVGHLNYLAVSQVGIFEFLTTNHFLGWGISVIFDLTFLLGGREFDSNFWENVKIPPYAPPPPRRLDIDRYIIPVNSLFSKKVINGAQVAGRGKKSNILYSFFFFFHLQRPRSFRHVAGTLSNTGSPQFTDFLSNLANLIG